MMIAKLLNLGAIPIIISITAVSLVQAQYGEPIKSSGLVLPIENTNLFLGRYTVSGSGAHCKCVAFGSGGSTPSLPTNNQSRKLTTRKFKWFIIVEPLSGKIYRKW